MRWESRSRTESERRRAWKAALAVSLALNLLWIALLPPFPTLAGPPPQPPPPALVVIPELREPPAPPVVRPPVIPLEALDEETPDEETIPDTQPEPGSLSGPPPLPPAAPFRVLDTPPRARRYSQPEYPRIARQAGVEGSVVVQATVDRDGRVVNARIVASDSSMFDEAALAAVRQWLFTPAEQSGVPVRAVIRVRLEFRLR